jgi:hypothetical protein
VLKQPGQGVGQENPVEVSIGTPYTYRGKRKPGLGRAVHLEYLSSSRVGCPEHRGSGVFFLGCPITDGGVLWL